MDKKLCNSVVILMSALVSVSGYSANWETEWGIDADVAYDDNFLMEEDEQDTVEYSLTPHATFSYSSPVATSDLVASLAVRRYSEFDEFDSEDPIIRWNNSYQTERANWSLDFGYAEYSQRDYADEDTGDFDSNAMVEVFDVNPRVDFQLSKKDILGVSFEFERREYDTNDFADNDDAALALSWRRQLTQKFEGLISGAYGEYTSEQEGIEENDVEYKELSIGGRYQLSAKALIEGSVGHFETDREQTLMPGLTPIVTNSDDSGVLLNFSFNYETELDTLVISFSHALYPSSDGEVDERDSIDASWRHRLSERSSAGISAGWSDTESEDEGNRESVRFSPFYDFRLTEKLTLRATYRFLSYDREVFGSVESNRAQVGFTYSF